MEVNTALLVELGSAEEQYHEDPRVLANTAALLLLGLVATHSLARLPDIATGGFLYPTVGSLLADDSTIPDIVVEDWLEELSLDLTLCPDTATEEHIACISCEPMSRNMSLSRFSDMLWDKQVKLAPYIDLALDKLPDEDVSILLTALSIAVKQRAEALSKEGNSDE